MVRALENRFLPPRERGAQQGARLELAALDGPPHAPRRLARAAGREVVAETQQERQQAVDIEVDAQVEHGGPLPPDALEQIGGRRARPADNRVRFRQQLHAARDQHPLQIHGGAQVGALVDEPQPAPLGLVQGVVVRHAAPVSHGARRVHGAGRRAILCATHQEMIQVAETTAVASGPVAVTDAAASKIHALLAEEQKNEAGLRVFVQGGGCSGFQYGLMIEEGSGDAEADKIFESNGIKLFVDPISVRYLAGAEVDFVDNLMGGGFTIRNPNAQSTCGCGQSFGV